MDLHTSQDWCHCAFHFTDMPWLIVIWMTVAPVPVIVLILSF
jgi:hypothetical protein